MTLTHILVDFENVQPSAPDIALVRGDGVRLTIFRGPGQKKYSADVAEAWQPLGDSVNFIRCAKAGRNALDMHIALYIGKLIGEQKSAGAGAARFIIVSKDTDYDPLLIHIRDALGHVASRVPSIKAALEGRAELRAAKASKAAPTAAAAKKTTAPKTAARKSGAKSTARKATTRTAALIKAPTAAKAPQHATPNDAKQKVIDSLRRMGERRPGKRKGLERHIESHLRRTLAPEAIPGLLAELEREGVLRFSDKKVEYVLPKERK
jgi:hypothetical protein